TGFQFERSLDDVRVLAPPAFDVLLVVLNLGPRVIVGHVEVAIVPDDGVQAIQGLQDDGLARLILADQARDPVDLESVRVPDRFELPDTYRAQFHRNLRCKLIRILLASHRSSRSSVQHLNRQFATPPNY